jgi:hypothetical protein
MRPTPGFARVLAGGQAVAIAGLSFLGAWILLPSPTTEPYYGQLASPAGDPGFVRGQVVSALANGWSVHGTLLTPRQTAETRDKLRAGALVLESDLELHQLKMRAGSIVRIVDSESAEIARLGLRGREAFFSVRTRATALRLRQPGVTLPRAYRCDTCPDGFFVGKIAVRGERTGSTYVLSITAPGVSRTATQNQSANLSWVAFSQFVGTSGTQAAITTALWLIVQFFLLSYWAATSTSTRRGVVAAACVLGMALVTQVLVPMIFRTGAATGPDWGAILGGAALGYWVALRSSSR